MIYYFAAQTGPWCVEQLTAEMGPMAVAFGPTTLFRHLLGFGTGFFSRVERGSSRVFRKRGIEEHEPER